MERQRDRDKNQHKHREEQVEGAQGVLGKWKTQQGAQEKTEHSTEQGRGRAKSQDGDSQRSRLGKATAPCTTPSCQPGTPHQ